MGWTLGHDDGSSVTLSHDDGFQIFASEGMERDRGTDWRVEVTDTAAGETLVQKHHEVADDEHLWTILDQYAERYP